MTACGLPLRDRHVQRGQDQLGAQVRLHRPADDSTRIHIEHHRQIQKSRPRRNVGDVGHPQSIGAIGVELPIDEINWTRSIRIGLRRDDVPSQRSAAKPCRAHQPGHTLASHANPVVIGELRMNGRRTVVHPASAGESPRSSPSTTGPSDLARSSVVPTRHRIHFSKSAAIGTLTPTEWVAWFTFTNPKSASRSRSRLRTRPRLLRGSPALP